jgi:hypothetical protein
MLKRSQGYIDRYRVIPASSIMAYTSGLTQLYSIFVVFLGPQQYAHHPAPYLC